MYKLTTKKALGDVYYADKIGEYDNIPAGYTKTTLDKPISYYESDSGSGGTSQVIINTATNEKYVSAYAYENGKSFYKICKLLEKLGVDERSNDEIWLVDYSNPVATYNPVWGSDNLPDGYKYDGTEIEGLYNVECVADKLTFTAKSSSDNTTDNSKGDTTNNPSDNTTDTPADEKPSTPESSTTNTVVDVSDGSTTIKADEIRKIIEDNKVNDVVIKSNNDVTFTFAKGTMKSVDGKNEYDFSTTINPAYADTMPSYVTKDNFVSQVKFNYSGQLPATASIRIPVGTQYAGKTLYYSYMNNDNTFADTQTVVVDEEGYITVKQEHCSSYVVTNKAPEYISSGSKDTEQDTQITESNTENASADTSAPTDENVDTPQTSDSNNVYIYVACIIFALTGVIKYGKMKKVY